MALGSIILFSIGILLTKFSSFLISFVLSWKYGAGVISDAVIISINIPVVIFSGFIAAVSLCFIPLYKEIQLEKSGKSLEFTVLLMNVLTIISTGLCFLLFWFPEYFIYIFAGGMPVEGFTIAVQITRWIAVASLLLSATGILEGYMQANNQFRLVSISTLPINIILSICILISSEKNIASFIGMGAVLAYSLRIIVFLYASKKIGFQWLPVIAWSNPYIRRLFVIVMPVVFGTLLNDINAIVDRNFASFLNTGSISVLDYSYKVAASAQGVLAFPITTILYTRLSEESSRKDFIALSKSVNEGIGKLSFIMIPTISCMIVVSDLIVNVLFFRGCFSADAAHATSKCLVLYLIGMYAISYRALLEKVFYSMHFTNITLQNTIITVVANIIMDFILYRLLGCYGLAMSTSISLIVSLYYLFVLMKRKTGIVLEHECFCNVLKMIMASGIMMIGIFSIRFLILDAYVYSFTEKIIITVSMCIIGFIMNYIVLLVLREKHSHNILRLMRRRIRNVV